VDRLSLQVSQLQQRLSLLERGTVPAPLPAQQRKESHFGLTAINRIGAITLIIGIIFFFKYAVDLGWIGPGARVVLGLLTGFLLITAAEWLRRSAQIVFAQGMAGCGCAVIYISVYAAFAYYHSLSFAVTFVALTAAAALALIYSVRHASAALATLGIITALLTPVLLEKPVRGVWTNWAYLLGVQTVVLSLALRQRWTVVIPLSTSFTIATGAYLLSGQGGAFTMLAAAIATLHFAMKKQASADITLMNALYLSGHGALLVSLMRLIGLWVNHNFGAPDQESAISALTSVLLAAYGVAALSFGIARKSGLDRILGLTLLGLVIVKLYLYDVWRLTRFYRISAFVALGVLMLTASYLYSRFKSRPGAS